MIWEDPNVTMMSVGRLCCNNSVISLARRCPLYTTEPETPSNAHLCTAATKNNQLTTNPPSRALIQIRISPRGKRTGADKTSPRHFLHAGRHQRLLLLEFSHTCSMVRYIILRKHLLLMPPIIAFRNKSSPTWFLQREVHLRHVKQTPILAPSKPPLTARTEE